VYCHHLLYDERWENFHSIIMDLIAKKYRVLKSLGQGAMGEVFLVLPPRGDPVALKLLKTLDGQASHQAVDQFENEFKVLKKLAHPNIGRIFDYGFDEDLKKVFFTLPWLKGTDIFNATKNLDFEHCEELFVQTLRALNTLHQKNIYHCDLKPGNIFIENNQALIIDFGLAGYWGDSIVGTPTYLAPEIYRGAHHNVLSDLYAAGVIFYNCLTRTQPFSGKNLQEVYDRHRSFTPPAVAEINPRVPKYFSDIIATLLNKKPEERFPSASEVIGEINAYSKKNYPLETEETLLSYLPTQSEMIGRQEVVHTAQKAINDFVSDANLHAYHVILLYGPKSVGKNMMVQKIKSDLQLAKSSVEEVLPPLADSDLNVLMSAHALILENIDSFGLSEDGKSHLKQFTDLVEQKMLSPNTTRFLLIVSAQKEDEFTKIKSLFPEEDAVFTILELLPYSKEETRDYLTSIIGQEIPKTFLEQFYRNTEGLPGVAIQLIQSMIEKGLLFDKLGRWNEDLLTNLDKTFEVLEISESFEQQFEKMYATLNPDEENIVNWLSLCPHGLTFLQLQSLTGANDLETVLAPLLAHKIIREEHRTYSFYRSVFQNFIRHNLPDSEIKKRHTVLAHPKTGLEKRWALYHLSYGQVPSLRLKATEKLAQWLTQNGEREEALKMYQRLIVEFPERPIQERLEWHIEASSLLIWLDRFEVANNTLSAIETEIQNTKPKIDFERFLVLLEKKGMALLHQEKIDIAKVYFTTGLKHAGKSEKYKMNQLRFENNLAEIELILGHRQNAINIFMKTREAAKSLSPEDLQKITNNDLGHVYLQQGQTEKAIPLLREDARIFSTLKNLEPLARPLYSLAESYRLLHQEDKAIRAFEECIKICKSGQIFHLLLRAYNGLGNILLAKEKYNDALKNYQRATEIAVRLNHPISKAALLYNQGYIYRMQNNTALATRRFLIAKQVIENKNANLLAYEENMLSRCYNELAIIASQEKNNIKALGYQLERMKLVSDSETLRDERFMVKLDLAHLYKENRLKTQFDNEIKELQAMSLNDEERAKIDELIKEWENIQNHTEQESTGRVSITA
jgi:tetratricopeptide (TPR) repeat protein